LTVDPRAWLFWAVSALVVASATRNPLYIIVLVLIVSVVGRARAGTDTRRQLLSPLRFAAVVVPLTALFNAAFMHFGETVLLRLPNWLPVLGGAVTLEALIFGATNGLTLVAIFSSFAVFNTAVSGRDLTRLVPRAFYETGVVLSIALSFLPQTTRSLQRIREAQAIRGHRLRGLRDWPPIVVPLLINGMERAMGLAEAMVARGYGATVSKTQTLRTQVLILVGLLLVLGGWLTWLLIPGWRTVALIALILGTMGILGTVWLLGRSVHHTSYRSRAWTRFDTLIIAGCAVAAGLILASIPGIDRVSLSYSPYPRLSLPGFDPAIGLGMLGLLIPAVPFSKSRV